MAEKIRGKGVISGIAMGKIMLAGQNLDGYLVSYQPEDVATEKQKAMAALTAVAEQLREGIEKMQKNDKTKEQAAILEAHRMMVQDPMMADNIEQKIDELFESLHSICFVRAISNNRDFRALDEAHAHDHEDGLCIHRLALGLDLDLGLELRRRLDEDRCRACMDASFVLDRYSCFRHVQYLFLPRWRTC